MVNSKFRSQLLETRLETRDAQLQLAGDSAELGFWTWEPTTGDLSWSQRCQSLLGIGVGASPTFNTLLAQVHTDDQTHVRHAFMQALQQKREFAVEFRLADDTRRVQCLGRPHASALDRNQPAVSGVLRATREPRNNASAPLAHRTGPMACRMESLRELERDALISRMQSEVSQSLDILKRGLETLAGNHQAELAPAIKAQLEELAREADAGMEAVRSAIFEMRPPGVQDLGFTGAVERYATEQAAAAGIALSLSLPQQALPVGIPTLESLYVVARTGIDNVIRHAHAKHLNISVIHDHKEIMLKVVDDGVGISDKDLMKDSAYSLFAASERLGTSGGELRVTGTPGRGTTLEATISLQHSRKSLRHNVTPLRVA